MKTNIIFHLLIGIVTLSCSNESIDSDLETNNEELTNYIFRTYDLGNNPNTVLLERNFTIENNKIISSDFVTPITATDTTTIEYSYENNSISEILRYRNNALVSVKKFAYVNGNLSEYLNKNIENNRYTKISFIHTTDTIYGTSSGSEDGINFNIIYGEAKIVLDSNKNKTYQEIYNVNTNKTSYTEYTYDGNNNMLTSNKFEETNGTFYPSLWLSYTYEDTINTLGKIYEKTYGREVLMLINQHREFQSLAVNYYDAKYIANNCFESVNTNLFGNILSAEFSSTTNSDNFSIYNDYKTLDQGTPISRFTYDFIFE